MTKNASENLGKLCKDHTYLHLILTLKFSIAIYGTNGPLMPPVRSELKSSTTDIVDGKNNQHASVLNEFDILKIGNVYFQQIVDRM